MQYFAQQLTNSPIPHNYTLDVSLCHFEASFTENCSVKELINCHRICLLNRKNYLSIQAFYCFKSGLAKVRTVTCTSLAKLIVLEQPNCLANCHTLAFQSIFQYSQNTTITFIAILKTTYC